MASRVLTISRDHSTFPQNGTTLNTSWPFFKFQTVQEVKREAPTPISVEEYNQGTEPSGTHEMCLECLGQIDPATCRTVNSGWGVGWHCASCGYLKKANEMAMLFLRGAHVRELRPTEVDQFKIRSFSWTEQYREGNSILKIQPLYMQVATLSQQGGIRVREALGDADFFSTPGIYDIIARGWWEERNWDLIAARIQGTILINHAAKHVNFKGDRKGNKQRRRAELPATTEDRPRKVNHFELVRSELRSTSGASTSLVVLSEFDLTPAGEKIRSTESGIDQRYLDMDKLELSRLLTMRLTGINRCTQAYRDQAACEWTLADLAHLNPEVEQRCWDFLSEILSMIRECLPNDGEYATVTFTPNTQRNDNASGTFTVLNKGPIDPNYLRQDFKDSFRI